MVEVRSSLYILESNPLRSVYIHVPMCVICKYFLRLRWLPFYFATIHILFCEAELTYNIVSVSGVQHGGLTIAHHLSPCKAIAMSSAVVPRLYFSSPDYFILF